MLSRIVTEFTATSPGGSQTADKSWAAALGVLILYGLAALGFGDWPDDGQLLWALQALAEGGALAAAAALAAYAKRNRLKLPATDSTARSPWGVVVAAALLSVGLVGCDSLGPTGQQSLETERLSTGAEGSVAPLAWSPPNFAGLNAARAVIPGENGPIVFEIVGGKEQETIELAWVQPDGEEIRYTAAGVQAFDGQAFRAEVERQIVETTGQTLQELAPEVRGAVEAAIAAACTLAGAAC